MADYKVIVAGAGPAGLAAAALLAKEGVATVLVAPVSADDPRTVALMQPSIQLLRYLDIWPGNLEDQTAPLRKLRIIDDTGSLLAAPNLEFESQELNLEAFGWNIPLGLLLPALRKRAEVLGVTFIEASAIGARSSGDAIHITLSNTAEISASFCLAADGAKSAMRKAAGIATDTWSYDQTAIATSFTHSMGHEQCFDGIPQVRWPFHHGAPARKSFKPGLDGASGSRRSPYGLKRYGTGSRNSN